MLLFNYNIKSIILLMSGKRVPRSTQTTHKAINWFEDYYAQNGRMPTDRETEALRGPTNRLRQRLGGLPGVALKIGLEGPAPKRYFYDDDNILIKNLLEWLDKQPSDILPTAESFTEAHLKDGSVLKPAQTYSRRYGSWRNALEETGRFKFHWSASECIGFCREAKESTPELNLKLALKKNNRVGFTPLFSDVKDFYPNLKSLSNWRLAWDEWQTSPKTKFQATRNIQSLISYGILTLTEVDGDMTYFDDANHLMHEQSRGPEFSKALYQQIMPEGISEKAGFIWTLDLIERAYGVAILGVNDTHIPTEKLGIGRIAASKLIHPTFMPELQETLNKNSNT
jgi:hypothetical protein